MVLMRRPPQTRALQAWPVELSSVEFTFTKKNSCMGIELATGWIWQLPGAVLPLGAA